MKILVYSGPQENARVVKNMLGSSFDVRTVAPIPEALYKEFEKCSVFLDASMKVPITSDVLTRAAALELVITATTGANHIDQNALKAKGIPLMTLADQKEKLRDITAAAEHSWLLLMGCARRFRAAVRHTEQGKWNRIEFPGIMLKGKTLGIIGLGRIGSWMTRYAHAFGMNVAGYDAYQKKYPDGINPVSLEELFRISDFISIHVNLTDENRGMITEELLNSIKPGCIFINTSRSELVNEEALAAGLAAGRIAAAGVDVLWGEPEPVKSPLWRYSQDHDNVVITPHIGGFCPEAVDIVLELSCNRILSFFDLDK